MKPCYGLICHNRSILRNLFCSNRLFSSSSLIVGSERWIKGVDKGSMINSDEAEKILRALPAVRGRRK